MANMQNAKPKVHHAWFVFVGLCFLGVGGFPLIFNLVGIYMVPVSAALGLGPADFSLWLTAEAVVSLVVMPIAGRLFKKKNINLIMTGGLAACVLGVAGFSFATELWQIVACGALLGIGVPFAFGLPQTVLIGNWFSKKYQGRMLSIAMACLVAAPIFEAPIFTVLLQTFGYQTTYLINAAIIAVLTIPWCLFAFKRAPEDMGLLPYGISEGDTASHASPEEEENDLLVGVSAGTALKTIPFWLTLVAACLICFAMGFENYSVVISGEFLPSLTADESCLLYTSDAADE